MKVGNTFKLIGRANVFTVTKVYLAAGFIPSVIGETTIRGRKFQTAARIADIVPA